MRLLLPLILLSLAACGEALPDSDDPTIPPSPIPDAASRLLVVRSTSWDATTGRLTRYERTTTGWTQAGSPIDVVIGKNGLGWGRGLHGDGVPAALEGPVKQEGDGKAPAGVFAIGGVYGYDADPPQGTHVPYVRLTDTWRCVDDGKSSKYNEVFDSANVKSDWSSAEKMLRDDELYRRVVIVDHNPPPARPGGGSCIFLHVWRDSNSTTSGCTAMPLVDLESVMTFLIQDGTVFVQMENSSYGKLAEPWELPP